MPNVIKRIHTIIRKVTDFILLHLSYLVGIGLPSFVAKLVKKSFLDIHPQKTNWKKYMTRGSMSDMY